MIWFTLWYWLDAASNPYWRTGAPFKTPASYTVLRVNFKPGSRTHDLQRVKKEPAVLQETLET